VVADDPALADVLVGALGLPQALAVIAHDLPDGSGRVSDEGPDRLGRAATPPRSLADVLAELADRDDDGRSGSIDVRILTLTDGSRRVIVDVTGTKSWDPLPTSDVTSLTTNGRALVGEPTAYEQGVLGAMRRAGVRPDDPVMLVGHSQGGMVAVTAARDAVRRRAFRVTHVVTAGSPIGRTVGDVPGSVQVLALENARDVVPHLDGRANPDRPNVTTVTGRRGNGTVADDHSLGDAYVPLAGDTEAAADRSVRDFLTGADGYFRAVRVETHVYQISRGY
jgi:pimeloyl-ACP methyl ester carboxylesterase